MLLLDVWTPLLALKVINYEKIKERAREREKGIWWREPTHASGRHSWAQDKED